MYVSAKKAAKVYGVSSETLRLWANNQQIEHRRTEGGHRRYKIPSNDPPKLKIKDKTNVIYARVSSRKQSADLQRQIQFLEAHCKQAKMEYIILKDIASGVNFKRKGLQTLLELAIKGSLGTVVVAEKDRLARISFDLIEWILHQSGATIQVLRESFTGNEIAEDVIAIITHYTAKYCGSKRYHSLLEDTAETKR